MEDLGNGDRVFTRDNGYQTLRWVGAKTLSVADLVVNPGLRPIRITRGALGDGLPERDMRVSPQHRMLFVGPRAEMLFGEGEVLVAATHLTLLPGVDQVMACGITYLHLLFDGHEIIRADGAWTESFQPAERTLNALDDAARGEIEDLFPQIRAKAKDFLSARPTLKAHEVKVLLRQDGGLPHPASGLRPHPPAIVPNRRQMHPCGAALAKDFHLKRQTVLNPVRRYEALGHRLAGPMAEPARGAPADNLAV